MNVKTIALALFIIACNSVNEQNKNGAETGNGSTPDTIKIGNQVWMARNLDVITYRNGDTIPQVQDEDAWDKLVTGAWCYYENKTANGTIYGKLYNWYAVNDPRGLAPEGWHIPTLDEWDQLSETLGPEAGLQLKAASGWAKSGHGNNKTGFGALPGGSRDPGGLFEGIEEEVYWWSATLIEGNEDAWAFSLTYDYKGTDMVPLPLWHGFYVRCIRN